MSVNEKPKWKQDEMFRTEEYPSPQGVAEYQPTRDPEALSVDEVRAIRRFAKQGQDNGVIARAHGLSSRACMDVIALRARADVPSDFESPAQRSARELKHQDNLRAARRAVEKAEAKSKAARGGG